jgi:ubiquinol-cytochrome c reductase cytochrome b subunit
MKTPYHQAPVISGPVSLDVKPVLGKRVSFWKQPLVSLLHEHLVGYPTPSNLTYIWGFGSLAGVCLLLQIVSGVFLAIHYTPSVDFAFLSVEHIIRDVYGGWLLRYMHANGASFFFIVAYLHILRSLYYGSYISPRELVWIIGVAILLLIITTAFIGYVLPWGQMSFWGATVITSLASAIPVVGKSVTHWLWGGFSVSGATLNRFYSLHYLLPFIIAGTSIVHIASLHQYGSNNPLGISSDTDKIPFYPYYLLKDLVGWVAFATVFSFFIYFAPNALGHPDNYVQANPMLTPSHIVPEWYFLPVYAILRSVPNKLGGVLSILLVFVALFLLPFLNSSPVKSSNFRPLYRVFFWMFVSDCLILGWIGSIPVEDPYVLVGRLATLYFFFYFLVFIPLIGKVERALLTPAPVQA